MHRRTNSASLTPFGLHWRPAHVRWPGFSACDFPRSVVLCARCDPRFDDCKIGGGHFRLALWHRTARQDRDELRGVRLHARVAVGLSRKIIALLLARIVAIGAVAVRRVLRVRDKLGVNRSPSGCRSARATGTGGLTGMASRAARAGPRATRATRATRAGLCATRATRATRA